MTLYERQTTGRNYKGRMKSLIFIKSLLPPLDADALERIAQAYATLPKPALVHCSAGVDRTGRALEYLKQRFDDVAPSSTMGTTGRRVP